MLYETNVLKSIDCLGEAIMKRNFLVAFVSFLLVSLCSISQPLWTSAAPQSSTEPTTSTAIDRFTTADRQYKYIIDTSESPDLREWATVQLSPVVSVWYPRIVGMLDSEALKAPREFAIIFHQNQKSFVAYTTGNRINLRADWIRTNIEKGAKGCVVHEMVHVVQQYWKRPQNKNVPGWLTEGIADYIRWYQYEPQSHGADIRKADAAKAKYDAGYRPTANFLNFVTEKYDKTLVPQINEAILRGSYDKEFWAKLMNKPIGDLAAEWRSALSVRTPATQK